MTAGVRSAADILRDVLADPDAEPITDAPWKEWVPNHNNGHGPTYALCTDCGRRNLIRARGMCTTCYRRDAYRRTRAARS